MNRKNILHKDFFLLYLYFVIQTVFEIRVK